MAAIIFATSVIFSARPASALSSALAASDASASAQDFYFDDFTVDFYLSRADNGKSRLKVVEHLTAVFPDFNQNHGITRVIPYTNNNGKNLVTPSDSHLSVKVERNGRKEPVSQEASSRGYFELRIGDANQYVHGRQEYTIEYEFVNIVLDQKELYLENSSTHREIEEISRDLDIPIEDYTLAWQELFMDTNGNDWSQEFNSATARVHLDSAISSSMRGTPLCYVGRYGTKGSERCTITRTSDGYEFQAVALKSRENLSFVINFLDQTFASPEKVHSFFALGAFVIAVILAVLVIIKMSRSLKQTREKRTYYKGLFVNPEYTPHKDYSVAEMGKNYLGSAHDTMVPTLLELAVTHKISLVKAENDKHKTEWHIKILSTELTLQQAIILKILAGSRSDLQQDQEIIISNHSASSDLISLAASYRSVVAKAVIDKGLTETPKTPAGKSRPTGAGLAITLVVWATYIIMAILIISENDVPYREEVGLDYIIPGFVILGLSVFVAGLITAIRTTPFFSHTKAGLAASRYLDGLKLYISMAEADRLKFLQSVEGAETTPAGIVKLYEKLLPYAALLGLETSWLKEMSKYYEMENVTAPTWYVGASAFHASDFSHAISDVSRSARTSIAHSTISNSSSSSSGHSSGGGFSGGGGGGGGGGGW